MLFLQVIVLVHRTASAVSKRYRVINVEYVWDKALPLNDGPLELPFSAQYSTNYLNQGYKVSEGSADPS